MCDLKYQIIYWNKGAENIYGYTVSEALGKSIDDVIPAAEGSQAELVQMAMGEKDEWKSEIHQTTQTSRPIIVVSRWTLVRNEKQQPDYYLVTNTDVTEQRRSEDHLLRAQRMESIGTLAGGIAHDFNNILSPIMMSVEMLKLETQDTETLRWLDMIRENAERGADLVKQVLTFARGMSGDRVSVQLKHIIKDLISVLSETLPKSIQLIFNVPTDLWVISADPTQIHQVLMNLCLNARDAMPSGGTLRITAENVVIDENYARMDLDADPGHYVLVTIEDTGVGMSRDVAARIFDPFFTTKDIGKGTGLGLSTSLMIVKGHNGFINVYSEPQKGARFSVYLPVTVSEANSETHKPASKYPKGNGELVLIADDEENIREVTRATLERFGYRVLTAIDGTDAAAIFAQNKDEIALLLTDMAMPFLDGIGTIRTIRRMNPDIRVIAMSGLMSSEQTAELDSLSVQDFISKPFTAEKLLNSIGNVLQKL